MGPNNSTPRCDALPVPLIVTMPPFVDIAPFDGKLLILIPHNDELIAPEPSILIPLKGSLLMPLAVIATLMDVGLVAYVVPLANVPEAEIGARTEIALFAFRVSVGAAFADQLTPAAAVTLMGLPTKMLPQDCVPVPLMLT